MYCVLRRLSPLSKGFLFKDILAGIQVNFCIIPPGSIFCNCFADWPEDWVLSPGEVGERGGGKEGARGSCHSEHSICIRRLFISATK